MRGSPAQVCAAWQGSMSVQVSCRRHSSSASSRSLPKMPFQLGPTLPTVLPSVLWHAMQPII